MSLTQPSLITYYRDFVIGNFSLVFGRLFPTLRVPPCDLSNKTAIITGANSGIGFEIALELAKRGATVYLACRNALKADQAVSRITSQVPSSVDLVKALSLDTSSLSSVRAFAQEWTSRPNKEIDLLFHNAGTGSSSDQAFTADGFPPIYATNFLGSFLLTHLLEPHLVPTARIILTTSTGQFIGSFSPTFSLSTVQNSLEPGFHFPAVPSPNTNHTFVPRDEASYVNSKSMQTAFATLLQRRFDHESGNRRTVHAFTPGFTLTPIFEKVEPRSAGLDPIWSILKATTVLATEASQGAATGVWLATTGDAGVVGKGKAGGYWDRMTRRVAKTEIMDPETVERFWVRWEADAGVEWR
ncbi:MAG: hypothetical protein Q9195_003529 [Heterodermia aff. obscurata]